MYEVSTAFLLPPDDPISMLLIFLFRPPPFLTGALRSPPPGDHFALSIDSIFTLQPDRVLRGPGITNHSNVVSCPLPLALCPSENSLFFPIDPPIDRAPAFQYVRIPLLPGFTSFSIVIEEQQISGFKDSLFSSPPVLLDGCLESFLPPSASSRWLMSVFF